MSRSAVEASISWDKIAIAVASTVVAIGLIGEYKQQLVGIFKLYWDTYPLKLLSVLWAMLNACRAILFPLLVVVGVVSETWYEADVSVRESAYTQLIDQDNVSLSTAAKEATERAADADQKTLVLEREAARLRSDNIELERIMTPRRWLEPSLRGALTPEKLYTMMFQWSDLGRYAGTTALLEVVPDYESQILANDILFELPRYGWRVQMINPSISRVGPLAIPEGVSIWTREKPEETVPDARNPSLWAWRAAESLSLTMEDQGLQSSRPGEALHHKPLEYVPAPNFGHGFEWMKSQYIPGPPKDDIRISPPEGVVVILIGIRPSLMELWSKQAQRERAASGAQ